MSPRALSGLCRFSSRFPLGAGCPAAPGLPQAVLEARSTAGLGAISVVSASVLRLHPIGPCNHIPVPEPIRVFRLARMSHSALEMGVESTPLPVRGWE